MTSDVANRINELERQLIEAHGVLIGGDALRKLLCYQTSAAFRQARHRGTLPVATLTLPHRQGVFAQAHDIARWLAETLERTETAELSVGTKREGGTTMT